MERRTRPPRIAVLGLHLEANAFAPPTTLEDSARQCVARGGEITALARAPVSRLPSELPGCYARMDTPGLTSPVLASFNWRRLPRPVFPLDPDAAWREPDRG